ncbi:MAG: cytidine deaminase [Sporichthyaceae bacterium]|nr:cytidine deaminase [Sporichthyaceae bacterium]
MTTEPVDPEDLKLVTLARSARARNGAAEGAAVRDETGRTYVATTVSLTSLRLTALQASIAAAVSSGAGRLEAAAVVTEAGESDPAEGELLAELAGPSGLRMLRADPTGAVRAVDNWGESGSGPAVRRQD